MRVVALCLLACVATAVFAAAQTAPVAVVPYRTSENEWVEPVFVETRSRLRKSGSAPVGVLQSQIAAAQERISKFAQAEQAIAVKAGQVQAALQSPIAVSAPKMTPQQMAERANQYLDVTPTADNADLDVKLKELGLSKKLNIHPKTLHHGKWLNIALKDAHKQFVKEHEKNCAGPTCPDDPNGGIVEAVALA